MPLYACTKCNTVENTATGDYWVQQMEWARAVGDQNDPAARPVFRPLCSACLTGTWHGKFPRSDASEYVPSLKMVGFLRRPNQDA